MNALATARAKYTNPAVMGAELASIESVYDRRNAAAHALRIAQAPGFRFGLTAEDTAAVVPVAQEVLDACNRAMGSLYVAARAETAQGPYMDAFVERYVREAVYVLEAA